MGLRELELVLDADARAFPPRLPAQPIFYSVMNAGYAAQIASEWNPTDAASGSRGSSPSSTWTQTTWPSSKSIWDPRHRDLPLPVGALATERT